MAEDKSAASPPSSPPPSSPSPSSPPPPAAAPTQAMETMAGPSSSPPLLPPSSPNTRFMSVLDLVPSHDSSNSKAANMDPSAAAAAEEVADGASDDAADAPQGSLLKLFRNDPSEALKLLEKAISSEALADMVEKNRAMDEELLSTLQGNLEEAHKTLRTCEEQKELLGKKIEETTEKIKNKRSHLESIRGELKMLSEEDVKLKKKRDASYEVCSSLKQKLTASREALQQLSELTSNTTTREGRGTSS